MPKNDNLHAARLYNSVKKHSNEQTADAMTVKNSLSKTADFNKKFIWAENICADLENVFDAHTVKAIRMDCACGPDIGKMNRLKKIYDTCDGLEEFTKQANKQNGGFTIECDGDVLYLIYPQCYCSCIKRVDKPITKTWCYCTLGYTRKMFEHVLGRTVDVELIESVKTGGTVCRIKIT